MKQQTPAKLLAYTIVLLILWVLSIGLPALLWHFQSKYDIIANAHNPIYAFLVLVGMTVIYSIVVFPEMIRDTYTVLQDWRKSNH